MDYSLCEQVDLFAPSTKEENLLILEGMFKCMGSMFSRVEEKQMHVFSARGAKACSEGSKINRGASSMC